MATSPKSPATGKPAPNAVRVTSRSPRGAIWRAGRLWTPQATTVARSEFSDGELANLLAEPLLHVEEVAINADGDVVEA